MAEYRYHRESAAYENLRANALLAFDGALGHVTEVLSGSYYQALSTSSPHQIWSAAMVVSPVLRGMLGLETDAASNTLTLTPHLPASWTNFSVKNLRVGQVNLDLHYTKSLSEIALQVNCKGDATCKINFRPSLSLRAKVKSVELNGRAIPFSVAENAYDQHVVTQPSITGASTSLRIRIENDFGLEYDSSFPALGSASEGLRILSETWSATRDTLVVNLSGVAEKDYELIVWNPDGIQSIDGATLLRRPDGEARVRVHLAATTTLTTHQTITLHFGERNE